MATNPADANKDGKVTKKEQAAYDKAQKTQGSGDTLSEADLEKRYNFAYDVITRDPELLSLWQKATNAKTGYWTAAQFQAALRDTDWYKTKSESARRAWTAEMLGGEDWNQQLSDAENRVRERAVQMGRRLSDEEAKTFARDYIYKGWGDGARAVEMDQALAAGLQNDEGFMRGEAGTLQQRMLEVARNNGLTFSPDYYESAARSVASGLTTEDDWLREVREQAASLWPTMSDKIKSGLDAKALASGYINTMAQTLELDPEQVSLDDPFIRQALTSTDEQGNPMSLWDFQQSLRKDPRWMQTKQANDQIASIGTDILKTFGFIG